MKFIPKDQIKIDWLHPIILSVSDYLYVPLIDTRLIN